MMRLLLAAAVLLVSAPAAASSPQTWTQGMTEAKDVCLKASELKNAATSGAPILFSDTNGKTAVLVTGTWRPIHMKNARAMLLCLYDRKTRSAETQEAKNWKMR